MVYQVQRNKCRVKENWMSVKGESGRTLQKGFVGFIKVPLRNLFWRTEETHVKLRSECRVVNYR